jgi:calcineurin-like phosphoesterase family protein
MAPVHALANAIEAGTPPENLFPTDAGPMNAHSVGGTIVDCAKTAAKFLWAEVTGNQAQSAVLAGELKYAECDAAGWSECVTTYLAYKALLQNPVYRPNKDVVIDLGTKNRIAIIGDWGTGDAVATNVLKEVAKLTPDVLLHVGDIYYADTQNEAQTNFLDVCRSVLGSDIPLFSLCGNHDMYSGGAGYYWLLDQIGQQASYFCLQNADWLFLAMDTGFNDRNPLTVASNMTALVNQNGWSEEAWHLNKIAAAGNRKIVLFSHHQLFSPFASVGSVNGQDYAYNPNLYQSFQTVLAKISAWFWGHEHTLAIYPSYMGLVKGRCVGASAVPVFTNQQTYANADGLTTLNNQPLPTWDPQGVLGNNGTDYDNCFAMLTLNGQSATVEYYTVPILQSARLLNVTDVL